VLDEGGIIIPLIKPQFELEREDIGKGGIVRDAVLHDRAVEKIRTFVTEELGREWRGLIDSPITGTDGNREFLALLS
jgi:23S rRNA (cytidine1920-2'-O)/16S rRNA (cytidine1409-2'-O)-methyltransferase